MNPLIYKYFLRMTNSFYSLERTIASTSLVSSTVNYVSYWSYLMMQFSPRISYEEKYTDAYTPESLKYNAYIVYGMIFSYLLYLKYSLPKFGKSIAAKRDAALN